VSSLPPWHAANVVAIGLQLLKELGAPVEHIVLPTFAYEHKIFVGPFSRKFPKAQIWVAPRQWSWPINLPLEFFGIFRAKPRVYIIDKIYLSVVRDKRKYRIYRNPIGDK